MKKQAKKRGFAALSKPHRSAMARLGGQARQAQRKARLEYEREIEHAYAAHTDVRSLWGL